MVGQPKFKIGDVVKFRINNEIRTGTIAIVDEYGIFMDDSEVYYDIMVKEGPMQGLYKHIKESPKIEKVGETDPSTIWKG